MSASHKPSKTGKPAFILDCDGTLMDSIGAWHEAEASLLSEAGITLSKEQRDELNSLTLEEAGAFFFERFGIKDSAQAVIDAIMGYLLDYYRTRSEAVAGALDFVRGLKEEGFATCVLSSSPQEFLQAGLARAGMFDYLDRVISVEDLGMTKRDLATYEQVCSLLGAQPQDAWLFDDSWYALRTAREAGLRTVGVFSSDKCGTHEELARYAELVIDDFVGLKAIDFV